MDFYAYNLNDINDPKAQGILIDKQETYDSLVQLIATEFEKGQVLNIIYIHDGIQVKLKSNHYVKFLEKMASYQPQMRKIYIEFNEGEKVCQKHPKFNLEFFCIDCSMIICYKCTTTDHNNHQYKPWQDYDNQIQSQDSIYKVYKQLDDMKDALNILVQKKQTNKQDLINSYEQFKVQLEKNKQIINNQIQQIELKSKQNNDQNIKDVDKKLENLQQIIKEIEQIQSSLNIPQNDYQFIYKYLKAQEIAKKNYDHDSLLGENIQWKLYMDERKLSDYLKSIVEEEINFDKAKTKFSIEQNKQAFVNEKRKIIIEFFDKLQRPTKNGVTTVKIINMINSQILAQSQMDGLIFKFDFTASLIGDNPIIPIINEEYFPNLQQVISVKSQIDHQKTTLSGLQQNYEYNTSINLVIKAKDKDDKQLTYGGEYFDIYIYQKDNFENSKQRLDFYDQKNGNYSIFGTINQLGNIQLSIKLKQNDKQLDICGSPFEFLSNKVVDFKDIYNLGVSEDYVPDWKVWEGIREIMQNWRDGMIENLDITINQTTFKKEQPNNDEISYQVSYQKKQLGQLLFNKKNNVLRLNNNGTIARSCLALGKSNKRNDPKAAGHFGEGMKLAALCLLRLKKSLTIKTGGEKWIFSINYDKQFLINMLFVQIVLDQINQNQTEIIIEQISEQEFNDTLTKIRFLENRPRMTDHGEVIYDPKEEGNIYVKGILVVKQSVKLSYDIQDLQIDRDRKLVADQNQLYKNISSIICQDIIQFGAKQIYDLIKNKEAKCYKSSELNHILSNTEIKTVSKLIYKQHLLEAGENCHPSNVELDNYNDFYDNQRKQIYKQLGLKIVHAPLLLQILQHETNYKNYEKIYQNYIIVTYNGKWALDLNSSQKSMLQKTIQAIEDLGLNYQYKNRVIKTIGNFHLISQDPMIFVTKKGEYVISPSECFNSMQTLAKLVISTSPNSALNFLE